MVSWEEAGGAIVQHTVVLGLGGPVYLYQDVPNMQRQFSGSLSHIVLRGTVEVGGYLWRV